jgi:hypothetical protein
MGHRKLSKKIEILIEEFARGNKSKFAEKIGVGEKNIRNYINGTEPKYEFFERIVLNYPINAEWLFFDDVPMIKDEKKSFESKTENPNSIESILAKKIAKDITIVFQEQNNVLMRKLESIENHLALKELNKLEREVIAKEIKNNVINS